MNRFMHHPGIRGAACAAALIIGFQSWAQAQNATTPVPQSARENQQVNSKSQSAKSNDQQANSKPVTLDTIVVTATKRAERLIEVPDSVTVVGKRTLEEVQANGIGDVAAYVPGLNVQSTGVDANRLVIRGLTTGPNDLSPTVGVVVDGVPFGASSGYALGALFSPDLDPSEIERVEVLRGPQGTLYGASTLGGLVRYVLKKPDTVNFHAHVRGSFGYDDDAGAPSHIIRAGVNIPVSSGVAGLTISGYSGQSDGSVTDVRTGIGNLNENKRKGGRIALFLTPTDNLALAFSALYGKNETPRTGNITGNAQTLQPTYGAYAGYNDLIGRTSSKYTLYSAKIDYYLPHGATFTSITGWSNFQADLFSDLSSTFQPALGPVLGPLLEFSGVTNPDTDRFTQEIRLTSASSDILEWQVGAFYNRESSDYLANILSTFMHGAPPPEALAPTIAVLANYETALLHTSYKAKALFGSVTYHFSPTFDVGAGLRYASIDQQMSRTVTGYITLIGASSAYGAAESSDKVWTESLTARWHFDPNAMTYLRIANGYRPGGPNVTGQPFEPDTTWNYEVGLKGSAFEGALQGSIAAYRINWSNIQLNFFNGRNVVIGNAGDARSQGVELEGAWSPIKALQVSVNLAYDDAKITSLKPGAQGGAQVGDQLPYNSKWTGSMRAVYHFPVAAGIQGDVGAGVRYKAAFNSTFPGDTGTRFYRLPSTTFLDLRAGLAWDHYDLRFQILNVTNVRKVTMASETLAVPVTVADAMGQPVFLGYSPGRTYGLSFAVRF